MAQWHVASMSFSCTICVEIAEADYPPSTKHVCQTHVMPYKSWCTTKQALASMSKHVFHVAGHGCSHLWTESQMSWGWGRPEDAWFCSLTYLREHAHAMKWTCKLEYPISHSNLNFAKQVIAVVFISIQKIGQCVYSSMLQKKQVKFHSICNQ